MVDDDGARFDVRPRRDGAAPDQTPRRSRLELCWVLAEALADYDRWNLVATDPNVSPRSSEVARNLARSCLASAKLGTKALAYLSQIDQGCKGSSDCKCYPGVTRTI